jgi:hypothetical protein
VQSGGQEGREEERKSPYEQDPEEQFLVEPGADGEGQLGPERARGGRGDGKEGGGEVRHQEGNPDGVHGTLPHDASDVASPDRNGFIPVEQESGKAGQHGNENQEQPTSGTRHGK